jgi:hypothetical protein
MKPKRDTLILKIGKRPECVDEACQNVLTMLARAC